MSGLRIYGVARARAFRALWIAEELCLACEHADWLMRCLDRPASRKALAPKVLAPKVLALKAKSDRKTPR